MNTLQSNNHSGDSQKAPLTRKRMEMSFRFAIRSEYLNSTKKVALGIRLKLGSDDDKIYYSSGVKVPADKWNQTLQRVTGNSKPVIELNERIAEIELQHREILRELKRRHSQKMGPMPTAKLIQKEFTSPGSTDWTLDHCYGCFLEFIETQTGTEDGFAKKTLSRYYSARDYIRAFLAECKEPQLRLSALTTGWGRRFHAWLQGNSKRKMKKDSANYYLGCVRKAIDYALEEGYIASNPLDKFRPKRGKGKDVYFLEPAHINRLMGLQLTDSSMSGILWWAKLMCLTGLDYIDAVRYAKDRTAYDQPTAAGKTKIVIKRSKPPRNYCEIIVLPEIEALFDEHPTGPYAPNLADVNRNLKVIADAIEFPLAFTSKICRKTAGAYFLRLGYQIATVSKMLGHSSIRTTEQHYVRVTSSQVDHDIERVAKRNEETPIKPEVRKNPFVEFSLN